MSDHTKNSEINVLEEKIAEVWKEILKIDQVARDQDFITLGGQSLHAVRIAFKCQKLLGKRVTTAQVMKHGTIAALAAALQ